METAKEQVQQILEILPDNASLDDMQYHVYVRQMIDPGIADADAGRVIPHEEVEKRLAKWRTKSSAPRPRLTTFSNNSTSSGAIRRVTPQR